LDDPPIHIRRIYVENLVSCIGRAGLIRSRRAFTKISWVVKTGTSSVNTIATCTPAAE
jgi:hypothetical protein